MFRDEKELILLEVRRYLPCQSGAQLARVPTAIDGGGGGPTEGKDKSTPICMFRKGTVISKKTMLGRVPDGVCFLESLGVSQFFLSQNLTSFNEEVY